MSLAQQLKHYTPSDKDKTWLRDMITLQPNRQGMGSYLKRAIMTQEPWKVQQVLDFGGRLDLKSDLALFSVAMEHGYDEVIERGLKDGLDASICGLYQTAVYYNNLDIVQKIEETGADINAEKDECLAVSARKGHTRLTRYLLDKCDYDAFALKTALCEAAANGRNENADLLYHAGANVASDPSDARVVDPMMMAKNNQHDHMVLWLNQKRGRSETYDLDGDYFKKQSVLGLQMKSNGEYDENGFVLAAKSGHFATLLTNLQDKTSKISDKDLDSKDRHGNNVIEILAERGELSSILCPAMWRGRLPVLMKLTQRNLTPRYQDQKEKVVKFIQQQATQECIQKPRNIQLKRRR